MPAVRWPGSHCLVVAAQSFCWPPHQTFFTQDQRSVILVTVFVVLAVAAALAAACRPQNEARSWALQNKILFVWLVVAGSRFGHFSPHVGIQVAVGEPAERDIESQAIVQGRVYAATTKQAKTFFGTSAKTIRETSNVQRSNENMWPYINPWTCPWLQPNSYNAKGVFSIRPMFHQVFAGADAQTFVVFLPGLEKLKWDQHWSPPWTWRGSGADYSFLCFFAFFWMYR